MGHLLEAPGFYGSNIFDSWAPDGAYYLVQSTRQDETPGFYFMDPDGQLAFRWHEEGFYSHRGRWAPDGGQVAFLSVPLAIKYPTAPDGWDEQPYGARVGILDLATGTARYADLGGGQVAFGYPLWAPDGAQVAITCGALLIQEISTSEWKGEVTTSRENAICLIDAKTGVVRRIGHEATADMIPVPRAWAPGGGALAVQRSQDRQPGLWFSLLPVDDGPLVELPGWPTWVGDDRLAVEVEERVLLVDQTGAVIRTLFEGGRITESLASVDGATVVIVVDSPSRGEHSYLLVLKTDTNTPPPYSCDPYSAPVWQE